MEYLYHGSHAAGITTLSACSALHHTENQVVYLTGNIPYALFYIWDEQHNHSGVKHVSGGIQNGIAFYEEQFPDQLEAFYRGVSGFLYCVANDASCKPVAGRESMFYVPKDIPIDHAVYIPDVYEELLYYEASHEVRILRYRAQSEKRQAELTEMIASWIKKSDFFRNDAAQMDFMKRYFSKAWENALR